MIVLKFAVCNSRGSCSDSKILWEYFDGCELVGKFVVSNQTQHTNELFLVGSPTFLFLP